MLRQQLLKQGPEQTDKGFRIRGAEITRIEGFSDAVFAFAVTLLVVSLEVPKTFDELRETMSGFVAFAICFALLVQIWHWHYSFFRRYGLQDNVIIVLNSVALFLTLFYVYPLKFLFTLIVDQLLGHPVAASRISPDQSGELLMIYGAGYLAIVVVFALLYVYAYRKRSDLALNELELLETTGSIQRFPLLAAVGILSIILATVGQATLAGLSYFLVSVVMTVHSFWHGHKWRALAQQLNERAAE